LFATLLKHPQPRTFCVAAMATTLTEELKRTAVFTRLTAAYKQFSEVSRPGLKKFYELQPTATLGIIG